MISCPHWVGSRKKRRASRLRMALALGPAGTGASKRRNVRWPSFALAPPGTMVCCSCARPYPRQWKTLKSKAAKPRQVAEAAAKRAASGQTLAHSPSALLTTTSASQVEGSRDSLGSWMDRRTSRTWVEDRGFRRASGRATRKRTTSMDSMTTDMTVSTWWSRRAGKNRAMSTVKDMPRHRGMVR